MKATHMTKTAVTWLMLLVATAFCVWAASMHASQATNATAEPTDIIKSILTQSGWEGKEVTIVGYYRGWDLLRETNQSPPVTRSDWVVKDKGGAIYVQAKSVEAKGQDKLEGFKQLRPNQKEDTNHIVRVTGVVRISRQKHAFIEPTRIELIK